MYYNIEIVYLRNTMFIYKCKYCDVCLMYAREEILFTLFIQLLNRVMIVCMID